MIFVGDWSFFRELNPGLLWTKVGREGILLVLNVKRRRWRNVVVS